MRILFLFILLSSINSFAQEPFYYTINQQDGLLSNEIYDIHISKEGFLYIAGSKGIQRYDGTKLLSILPDWNKSLTLIKEDIFGGIFFHSFDGGYWRYTSDSVRKLLPHVDGLYALSRYTLFNDVYAFMTGVDGIYIHNVQKKTEVIIPLPFNKKGNKRLEHIRIIGSNKKYVYMASEWDQFFRIDSLGHIEELPFLSLDETITNLEIINYNNKTYLVCRFNDMRNNTGQFELYEITGKQLKKKYTLNRLNPRSMLAIRVVNNRLFYLSRKGFWELNKHFQKKQKDAQLAQYAISDIVIDSFGRLWCSSLNAGVIVIPDSQTINISNAFNNHNVKQMITRKGNIYYLTDNGALYKMNSHTRFLNVKPDPNHSFAYRTLHSYEALIKGGAKEYLIDMGKKSVRVLPGLTKNKKMGWLNNEIFFFMNRRNLGFAFKNVFSKKKFMNQFSLNTHLNTNAYVNKKFDLLSNKQPPHLLNFKFKRIYDVLFNEIDSSFYAAFSDSLYHYYPNRTIRTIYNKDEVFDKDEEKNIKIRYLHQTKNGTIWAIGHKGLLQINRDSIVDYINKEDGLLHNHIDFYKSFGDTLLLGFSDGLCLFTEKEGVFQKYYAAIDFPSASVQDATLFQNKVLISTTNGMYSLPVRKTNIENPKAFIRYILVNKKRWDARKTIPYKYNHVVIHINGVDLNAHGNMNYFYRLHEDKDWIQHEGTSDNIEFSDLVEGHYNFQLKATSPTGKESDVVEYSFGIGPPFTRSWLFYLLCFLLITGIASLIFWYRIRSIRKKAEFNKQLKQSEITAIKAQMNPHFVFNALNSIQNWIITNNIEKSNLYLGKFSDLVRKTLEASENNTLSVKEEIETIRLYLELENQRFDNSVDITYDINILESRQEEIHIPAMLIQPYVENVFKHGLLHKKGEKEINILFQEKNDKFYCEIIDNGVGRKRAKELNWKKRKHKSFSTQANRKRIDLLNEMYDNQIELSITDAYPQAQNVGTRVILILPIVDPLLQNQ